MSSSSRSAATSSAASTSSCSSRGPSTLVYFYRNDLRVHDNPCFHYAHSGSAQASPTRSSRQHTHVVHLYCFDPDHFATTWHYKLPKITVHRTRFLLDTVQNLSEKLVERDSELIISLERPKEALRRLIALCAEGNSPAPVKTLVYQKEVTHEELLVEGSLHEIAEKEGVRVLTFEGMQLQHPADIPYDKSNVPRNFTLYRKGLVREGTRVRDVLPIPSKLKPTPTAVSQAFRKTEIPTVIELLKGHPSLDVNLDYTKTDGAAFPFVGGEDAALARVKSYVWDSKNVLQYKVTRNGLVGTEYSSKFSAFLANGCLSPRYTYHEAKRCERAASIRGTGADNGVYWVIFELMWRDYFRLVCTGAGKKIFYEGGIISLSKNLMPWWPVPQKANEQRTNEEISMEDNDQADVLVDAKEQSEQAHLEQSAEWFERWSQGRTGVPFVDANMRELLQTGWMSNRGRQNVASFLIHDLHIDWRRGAEWFESMLLDHDVCSNYANWNSAAGLAGGPRNRKFNVVKQAVDYDPGATYIKHWVPELAAISHPKHVIAPWTMSLIDQHQAGGFKLGKAYPRPIVCPKEWAKYVTISKRSRANSSSSTRGRRTGAGARNAEAKRSRRRGIDFYFKGASSSPP